MKSLLFFVGIIAALGLSFILVGFCAPVEQSSEVSKEFECSKSELWNNITDIERYAKFKDNVSHIEFAEGNKKQWIEYSKIGPINEFEILEWVEGEKLVLKITDPKLKVEKKRVYTVYGDQENSVLSIKEFTKIDKLLLRSTMAISGLNQEIRKELNFLEISLNL